MTYMRVITSMSCLFNSGSTIISLTIAHVILQRGTALGLYVYRLFWDTGCIYLSRTDSCIIMFFVIKKSNLEIFYANFNWYIHSIIGKLYMLRVICSGVHHLFKSYPSAIFCQPVRMKMMLLFFDDGDIVWWWGYLF